MAKKRKGKAADEQGGILDAVSASAEQIWQAGLGAFAATRQDGGKLFDALVHDGAQLHKMTWELGLGKTPDVAGKVGRIAEDVARQANASWEKIEQYFEERMAETLHRMGVPSRDDVDRLRRDIKALEAAVRLSGGAGSGAKAIAPAARAKTSKPVAKRAASNGAAAKSPA
jgi:poly(hydroxyalkanoate) granule-associated protein